MKLTFEIIEPLIVSEKWLDNRVRLSFKANNQENPIEVMGFMQPIEGNPAEDPMTALRKQTILHAFTTLLAYYKYDHNNWVYTLNS